MPTFELAEKITFLGTAPPSKNDWDKSGPWNRNKEDSFFLQEKKHNKMSEPATYKVVLLGSGGCGKTTWIRRHISGQFVPTYFPTVGVEVHPITFKTSEGDVRINFWDTAGQEKLGGLRDGYYIQADASILFYDSSSKLSYNQVAQWNDDFERVAPGKPKVVCGNKVDLPEDQLKVTDPAIHRDLGCPFYFTSGLSLYNYEKPILEIVRRLRDSPNLTFVETVESQPLVAKL